jgi:hypothetical protein
MDTYLTALALGGVGLAGMAVSGIGRHGSSHGAHSHDGSAHGGHGHTGMHLPPGSNAPGSGHNITHGDAAGNVNGHVHGHVHGHAQGGHSNPLLALMSPRLLFSVALGMGTAGLMLRSILPEPILIATSIALGVLFERAIVAPLWNLIFRFESRAATTLESSLMDEARAVTAFDRNGQGLIAVEVDGQMVQVLGTLQSGDRAMNVKVPVGARLRIEDVDARRNRCTVSLI